MDHGPVRWQKPYIREFIRESVRIYVPRHDAPRDDAEKNAVLTREMSDALKRVAYVHGMPGSLELYEEMTADAEVKP